MKTLKSALLICAAFASFAVVSSNMAFADEPKMDEALKALQHAHDALSDAKANKDGHREKALKEIEEAMDEIKAGIAASAKQ